MTEGEKVDGHAFISYVREDSHQVDRLEQTLQAAGISVWRDTADIWPGEDWRLKIRNAITQNALVFIACFSSRSIARESTYQNEELLLAIEELRQRRPDDPWLIPIRFDDCDIPDRIIGGGRTLASIQRADLFGDRADKDAKRLIAAILRLLRQPSNAKRLSDVPPTLAPSRLIHSLMGHTNQVYGVAFSPDGTLLATASLDKTARLWNTATGAPVMTVADCDAEVYGVAFEPNGSLLATASRDKTARLWSVATAENVTGYCWRVLA